jgi:hypothetical protein
MYAPIKITTCHKWTYFYDMCTYFHHTFVWLVIDAFMSNYIYNKNVPIPIIQSPYFYNGFSGSVPIFINSRTHMYNLTMAGYCSEGFNFGRLVIGLCYK